MGAAPDRIFSSEDSLKALAERAAKDEDRFVLKVFRRTHLAAPQTVIALFEEANMQHFNSPELWLPALAGGGKFQLLGYHQTDMNKPVGSFIGVTIDSDEPRDVDIAATKRPDWRGPGKLAFPAEKAQRSQADMPLYDVRSPPAPGSGDSATRSAWTRQAGGGVHRQQYDDNGSDAFGPRAYALEAERRKLEAEKLADRDERHKAELAARDAAHKAETAAMRSELMAEIRSLRDNKPTGPDPMVEFMKMQADDRRAAEALRREDARLERERQDRIDARSAEDRKFERERQDRIDARLADERRADRERSEKMFEKISGERKDPLEMLEKAANIIAKKGDNSDMLMKSMNNMMEVQSTVMGSTMDFVEHVSRLNLGGGEDEPGWVKGVDKLMKGIGNFVKAGARPPGPAFPPQPQVQAQNQRPPQPPQPQPPPTNADAPIIDQIIGGIYAHYDPEMVAKALIAYYQDASIQKALAEAGNDPEKALLSKLGNWPNAAPQNAAYLKTLIEKLENALQQAGFFAEEPKKGEKDEPEPETDPDDDSEGEEEEDAEVEEGDENEE